MVYALVSLAVFVVGLLAVRTFLVNRVQAPPKLEPVVGATAYKVGDATVFDRAVANPKATVVAMHGYLESVHYFTHYYSGPEVQLIAVASGDYYAPGLATAPAWATVPTEPLGTIEYDAEVLNQALEHLPQSKNIRVHGHSRGGAVVLEASKRRPDLFATVEVVLEAAVLPEGTVKGAANALVTFLMPLLVVPMWRANPISKQNAKVWGDVSDPRKKALIMALPFNPRRVSTMITNLSSLMAWQKRTNASHYEAVRGHVIIAGKDKVLDSRTMAASAERAVGRLNIIHAPTASHFILLDTPELIPPLQVV